MKVTPGIRRQVGPVGVSATTEGIAPVRGGSVSALTEAITERACENIKTGLANMSRRLTHIVDTLRPELVLRPTHINTGVEARYFVSTMGPANPYQSLYPPSWGIGRAALMLAGDDVFIRHGGGVEGLYAKTSGEIEQDLSFPGPTLCELGPSSPSAMRAITRTRAGDLRVRGGAKSESDPPKFVLTHSPSSEVDVAALEPSSALFERCFNPDHTEAQHKIFREMLRAHGAEVITVTDVLLHAIRYGTDEEKTELHDLARRSFDVVPGLEAWKERIIREATATELISFILHRPRAMVIEGGLDTVELRPLMNLVFMRDQSFDTPGGSVLARLNSSQRDPETDLVQFIHSYLRIPIALEITGEGRVEGGDYMSAGDVCFLGMGLRTNQQAVDQMTIPENFRRLFPHGETLAVVIDGWANQQQMHFDTYANIPREGVLMLVANRLPTNSQGAVVTSGLTRGEGLTPPKHPLKVDLYEWNEGDSETGPYVTRRRKDFLDYIVNDLGWTIVPVSEEDQAAYGVNGVNMGNGNMLAIEGCSDVNVRNVAEAGAQLKLLPFNAITAMFGGMHCNTKVIR